MKNAKKIFVIIMCAVLTAACIISSVPKARAAGVLRMIIDNIVYSKEYTDLGALALTHWHYDASDDILTLENFGTNLKPQSEIFVYPYSGNLTINLKGDNYIYSSSQNAMIIIGNVKFTGDGTLTIICDNTYAINTDYTVSITENVSLNINALAGIMAIKGINISTSGTVNIHTSTRCMYTFGDLNVTAGKVRLTGSDGLYSSKGNVYLSGGDTDVEVTARSKAFALYGEDAFVEWSANGSVGAGDSSPGSKITEYTGQKYFRATFTGTPVLNPPRTIYWDDTVIDSAGTTNPVARWNPVGNATGYVVNLYYLTDIGYELKKTFTVTDALSCNFGGHFTTYGKYFFTVQAIGDGENFITSAESPKSSDFYMFTGDVASRFYVSLPESEYFTIIPESGSTVVYYGEDYSFTIEVDPAYTQSEILVWANKARVALRDGKYTVDNVTENITIKVGELSMNTYTVNLPESEAFTIYPLPEYSTEVEYGGSFAFSIELADIYMQSNPVVTSNGEVLKAKYGIIYTISNITEDQTVEITGLIRDNYEVSFKTVDGTVLSTQTVDHGYTASAPDDPAVPEGMSFIGWTDENGEAFDFNTPIEEHTTVYARFETQKDSDGYYLISNLEQLMWFRDEVLLGNTNINGRLTADIEMNNGKYAVVGVEASFYDTATVWKPIGGYDYNNEDNYVKFYEGDFDGDGHTLSGFYIKHDAMSADASEIGIFGILSETASVTDLNVIRSYFEGYGRIGSIAGKSEGKISGCSSSAVLAGIESVGGIVGETSADVTDCSFSGRVSIKQYRAPGAESAIGGMNAGGIVGHVVADDVNVSSCTNSGTVGAYEYAGGILGCASGSNISIDGCVNSGAVTSDGTSGGIVASVDTVTVKSSSNSASVKGKAYSGGILGSGNISGTLSFNSGAVNGNAAGGILGGGTLDMSYFYNAGSVTGEAYAGGISAVADSVVAKQAHSCAQVSAEVADALCASLTSSELTNVYYCSYFNPSSVGTAVDYTWFYSGYIVGLMNRENGSDFWAHNGYYPIFADEENPAFAFELKESEIEGTYLIENERDLHLAAAFINNEGEYNLYNYVLNADITMHRPDMVNNINVIGSSDRPYSGYFDGGSHFISGLNISGGDNTGLFGYTQESIIENLTVKNSVISGGANVGTIIGNSKLSYVSECNVSGGSVSGTEAVGGVVGISDADVYYCTNSSSVSGSEAYGGILGSNDGGAVDYCYNSGSVSGIGTSATEGGGVVGRNFGTVTTCANIAPVSGKSYVGGVVGSAYGDMRSVYNAGLITGSVNYGSICGEYDDTYTAELCYYLEGTSGPDACIVGTAQSSYQITNGSTAYFLNADGTELVWAQGSDHPVFADLNGSDAVIYTVTFETFDEFYWMAATKKGGGVIAPPNPDVRGYTFIRWDTTFNYIVDNTTVRAIFDKPGIISFISTSFLRLNDHDDGAYIYGIYPNLNMTASQLRNQISNIDVGIFDQDVIFELENNDRLYTGVTVIIFDDDGSWLHIANVVIYGDINSDGYVDQNDAFLLNLLADGMLSEYDFTYAQYLAADVNHDGVVDKADALFLQNHCIKNTFINQLPS